MLAMRILCVLAAGTLTMDARASPVEVDAKEQLRLRAQIARDAAAAMTPAQKDAKEQVQVRAMTSKAMMMKANLKAKAKASAAAVRAKPAQEGSGAARQANTLPLPEPLSAKNSWARRVEIRTQMEVRAAGVVAAAAMRARMEAISPPEGSVRSDTVATFPLSGAGEADEANEAGGGEWSGTSRAQPGGATWRV